MFCVNCGKQIPDGQRMCPECMGQQPVQQPVYQQPQYQQPVYQQPAYQQPVQEQPAQQRPPRKPEFEVSMPARKKPKKGGSSKLPLIIIALVVVAALVLAIINWSAIVRFFKRSFAEPTDYLRDVESYNAKKVSSSIAEKYGKALESMEKTEAGADMGLTLELGDTVIGLLETAVASEMGEMDLNWLKDISLSGTSNRSDNLYSVDLGVGLNSVQLLTASMIMDMDAMEMYVAIPELNATFLKMKMSDMDDVDMEAMIAAMSQSEEMTDQLLDILPSAEELEELINTYYGIIAEHYEDAEKATETVEVNGVEQDLLKLTVELSQKDVVKIAIAALEKAEKDKTIKGILDGMSEMYNSMPDSYYEMDMYEEFQMSVSDMLEELEYVKDEASSKNFLTVETYVDGEDDIVGRCFTVEMEGEEMELYYIYVESKGEFACEAEFGELTVSGEGTVKKDQYNGEIVMSVYDEDYVTLELQDLLQAEDSTATGTLRLIPETALLNEMGLDESTLSVLGGTVALELTLSPEQTKVGVAVGNETLIAVGMALKELDGGSVSIPSDAVDVMDNDAGMKWVAGISFDKLISNLSSAGVPSEYVDALKTVAEMFAAEFQ